MKQITARSASLLLSLAVLSLSAGTPSCVSPAPEAPPVGADPGPEWVPDEVLSLDEGDLERTLREVHERFAALSGGEVSAHNDVAARTDPALFGIAVATVDGELHSFGDDDALFPLQSLSKTFTLARALEDVGPEVLLARVGVHATGLPFGSLAAFEVRATPLQNPMVSAGAIMTTGLVAGADPADKWSRTLATLSRFAGRALRPIDAVHEAEMEGSAGSLAKAYTAASLGLLGGEPDEVVTRYLRTCAVGVTARDLALMGATLANGGVHPRTGERVVPREVARGVLSAMITAGMYDDSGPWYFRVGLPAKSGVSGGLLAVAPGRLAIAVYSPPLDEFGNSVRGQAVIEWLAARWGLHDLDRLLPPRRDG